MLSLKRTFPALFLAVGIEASLNPLFPAPDRFPHISLLVLLYAALEGGGSTGLRCGLWLGFMLDMLSTERFGTHAALYAAVGGLCGLLRGKVFAEAFISQWALPAAAYPLILAVLSSATLATEDLSGAKGFVHLLMNSAYFLTVLVSPLVFVLCEKCLHKRRIASRGMFVP